MSGASHADIIIIGAGLSGMVAAYNILQHEPTLKIFILEAKGRVGGRTLSVPIKTGAGVETAVDLGGHWVCSQQRLLLALVERLGLTLVPQHRAGIALADIGNNRLCKFQDHPIIGNLFCQYELTRFFAKLESLSEQCNSRSSRSGKNLYLDTLSMEGYIQKHLFTNTSRNLARTLVRTSCGSEPSAISVYCFMVYCNGSSGFTNTYMCSDGGAREFWIREGAQEICNRILEKLDTGTLFTSSPVLRVQQTDNDVIVYTTHASYKCSHVIVAIPPSEIMKVVFEPTLSEDKLKILSRPSEQHFIKFVITYRETFWKQRGFSGELLSLGAGPVRLCYDTSKEKMAILTGVMCGGGGHRRQVLEQLARYWGREALQPLDYLQKDWAEETYNGCCPTSRPSLNTIRYYGKISEALGRVHWAGTETASAWNGYMEGAVQAGHRAAMEVLYYIRPQSLSFKDMVYYESKNVHRKRLYLKWYLTVCHPVWCPVVGAALLGLLVLYARYS